ncbi:MAG: coproporphyrinogen-III oxidase family protein, partial [Pseudomonadota bacterium]
MAMDIKGFGVYVHYPRCRKKCGYCDFASLAMRDFDDARYMSVVERELEIRAVEYQGAGDLHSIYVGGGTPSLCQPMELKRIIKKLSESFSVAEHFEVTVEVNPGTVDTRFFELLLEAGVNRVSLGLQSMDDQLLRLLGREHDAASGRKAFRDARAAGFGNIGCDLIFAVPGQSLESHLKQLKLVLELEPNHVSTYSLTLSVETSMYRAGFRPADEDLVVEMMEAGREVLEQA